MTDISYYQKKNDGIPSPEQETLLTTGWDSTEKGKINWPDFNNLLFFYCIRAQKEQKGDQFSKEALQQAESDEQELRDAIEKLPILKGSKPQTAEQRLNANNQNLEIGKKWIMALVCYHTVIVQELNKKITNQQNDFRQRTLIGIKARAFKIYKCLCQRYGLPNKNPQEGER